jgi:hypothetical protein
MIFKYTPSINRKEWKPFIPPEGKNPTALEQLRHGGFQRIDEPVKSQKPEGFAKSSSYGAEISAA